uniref:HMA domain-containing protein n=2 Tax=Physcomitrium patens TaxID=3218 RepID=A0A2K1KTK5_PHYPA|nr:heavy metal-associated isoprenylated plant protein 30-like [Physcomitrium patens]PNR57098.1 hypothetical protein PHYPA_004091 [Physcomitrium patens]|eukprot:XP_024369883.1 heavy metal-associated isoprenylated plant protein 30-like [Physcomitrella patens]
MAMSMQEMFYGGSEPAFFVQYGRQAPLTYSHVNDIQVPKPSRQVECITFDLMVPMCCIRCEDQVRDALYALRSVQSVLCDAYNQRVTVSGYLEPAQALKHLKRVRKGATFCSQSSHYKQHKYEVSSYQISHSDQHEDRSHMAHVQYNRREQISYSDHSCSSASSDTYSRSLCPAYRDTARTHYMSVPNPTIATRVEREF